MLTGSGARRYADAIFRHRPRRRRTYLSRRRAREVPTPMHVVGAGARAQVSKYSFVGSPACFKSLLK